MSRLKNSLPLGAQSSGFIPSRFMLIVLLSLAGCQSAFKSPPVDQSSENFSLPRQVWLYNGKTLKPEELKTLNQYKHLLIMIPGVTSGDLEEGCRFLEHVRAYGGHDLGLFYNWGGWDLTRTVASPTSTANAAARLVKLCGNFQREGDGNKSIDILAHSAGTIVANKAAVQIRQRGAEVKFRNVLFLGTPHAPDVNLDALKSISENILNVYSGYDKINRNVSGNSGILAQLAGKPYRNLCLDTSLGGRRIRHYAFLKDNPENWVQYGSYLQTGDWPQPLPFPADPVVSAPLLHRVALWIRANPAGGYSLNGARQLVEKSLAHANPRVKYYGVILAGLLKASGFAPRLKEILKDPNTPVYLRTEIYQALGNFEDGRQIRFLQRARKEDKDCGEELRDVLRELKLKRIRPVRER